MSDLEPSSHKEGAADFQQPAEVPVLQRLELPRQTAGEKPKGPGYRLYEPRPTSLGIALWLLVLVSAAYVILWGLAGFLRFFAPPPNELEYFRLVPAPPGGGFWLMVGAVLGTNLLRLVVLAYGLGSRQAGWGIRLAWLVGVLGGVGHSIDFLGNLGPKIFGSEAGATSPLPLALAAVIAGALLLYPSAIRWTWVEPPIHVPDWTYGGPKERPPGWKPPYVLDEEILRSRGEIEGDQTGNPQSTGWPTAPSR
jgi:hypothetical protein